MPKLRTLAIPAVILLSGGLLAGCGDDTEPTSSDSDEMMEETMAPTDDAMMEEDSMEDDAMEEDAMEDDAMEEDAMEEDGSMEHDDAMDDGMEHDDSMEDEG